MQGPSAVCPDLGVEGTAMRSYATDVFTGRAMRAQNHREGEQKEV